MCSYRSHARMGSTARGRQWQSDQGADRWSLMHLLPMLFVKYWLQCSVNHTQHYLYFALFLSHPFLLFLLFTNDRFFVLDAFYRIVVL